MAVYNNDWNMKTLRMHPVDLRESDLAIADMLMHGVGLRCISSTTPDKTIFIEWKWRIEALINNGVINIGRISDNQVLHEDVSVVDAVKIILEFIGR